MSDSAEVSVRDNHKILLNFRTIVGEEENANDWEIKVIAIYFWSGTHIH